MNMKNLETNPLDMSSLMKNMMGGPSASSYNNRISSNNGISAKRASSSKQSGKRLKKRLPYNFKMLSSQLMKTKTSLAARTVLSKAYRMLAALTGYKYATEQGSGDYDLDEIEAAIAHVKGVTKVARKRVNHLKEEEDIKNRQKSASSDLEDKNVDMMEEFDIEDMLSATEEDMEKMMQEFQETMESLSESDLSAYGFSMNDLSSLSMSSLSMDDLSMSVSMSNFSMDDLSADALSSAYRLQADQSAARAGKTPEDPLENFRAAIDLENLKKKHRAKELRELMEADMKYLRFLFNKLAREKQQAALIGHGNSNSNNDSGAASCGVSLELSGAEVPVAAAEAPAPAEAASAVVDVSV